MSKLTFKPLAGVLDEYELISFLPFQIAQKPIIGKTDIEIEDALPTATHLEAKQTIPNWVKQLSELGERGEIIALNYLKSKYNNVSWVADQTKLGYDILADNELFEVKTTGKSLNAFYISLHELRIACENKQHHHLMFIKLNQSGAIGYMFDNIFEKFSIDVNELIKNSVIYKNDLVTLTSKSYLVELDENVIESAEVINLSPFCGSNK